MDCFGESTFVRLLEQLCVHALHLRRRKFLEAACEGSREQHSISVEQASLQSRDLLPEKCPVHASL